MVSKFINLVVLIALTACSYTPAQRGAVVPMVDFAAAEFPGVAAEFITTRAGDEHDHVQASDQAQAEPVQWRLWRDNTRIVTERPQLGIGELWQKDGQTSIHRKLYHADQRAIEFQLDDLKMLEAAPSWQKLSLLLDPALLKQLASGDIEWSDEGYPTREYEGKVAETTWRVLMRMDLGVPLLIERQQGEFNERTELQQVYPLQAAPWQATASDGYEIIDYADLGDKESDLFVIKVQEQMGREHHH